MAGISMVFEDGPITCEAASNITGGQLVEAAAGTPANGLGLVQPAGAGSIKVMGVALKDAVSAANQAGDTTGTTVYGSPFMDTAVPTQYLAVARDCCVRLTYAAAANYGDRLIAAANGQVTPVPAVTTPTPADVTNTRAIIGICREPAGVAAAGVGLTELDVI